MGVRMNIRVIAIVVALAALTAACGGGDGDKAPTSAPSTSRAASASTPLPTSRPATAAVPTPTSSSATASSTTAAGSATTPASGSAGGAVFDATQAKALIDEASLKPADIAADWVTTSDTSADNAAAAAADPTTAASNERCGRLLGRTITNGPADVATAYITGEIVAAFSQLTVYATPAGAADCAAEGTARFQQPGALARAFGTIFLNPEAVTVQPLTYEQVGDGSFAAALTGDINANGLTVQLQIVMVAFLKGNTTGVVGIAQSPLTNPDAAKAKPYIDLTLQRITANQ
jgi:hypothetical protein